MTKSIHIWVVFVLILINTTTPGFGQETSDTDLAKKTQNPLSDLISVPFQNNFNFGVGPGDDLQYVLNIQPVYPMRLTDNWNLINRVIAPIIYQPELAPGIGKEFGLGDIVYQGFFSPAKAGKMIWGARPVISFPTATDEVLGTEKWSLGPTAVALTVKGPWVIGALAYNLWSVDGDDDREDVNFLLFQYFINYNFPNGTYLTSAPIITADWEADSDDRWTIPLGLGVGKVFRVGKQPINCSAAAYYNIEHPDNGPEWQLRIQIQLLFPKR